MLPDTITLPTGWVLAGGAWCAASAAVLAAAAVFCSPMAIIVRPAKAYWADWNTSQAAPWFFWHLGGLWYRLSELLGNWVLPAPQRVADMASSFFRCQAIITLNELGVPEALQSGPKTAAQLAKAVGAHAPYLSRVLRLAERMKLVRVDARPRSGGEPTYALTQLSAVLCGSHPNCLKHMVSLLGDHFHAAAHLTEGVRRGVTPYAVYAGGLTHWEHMRGQPELYERFNRRAEPRQHAPARAAGSHRGRRPRPRAPPLTPRPPAHARASRSGAPSSWQGDDGVWGDGARAALLPRMSFTPGSFFDAGVLPPSVGAGDVYVMRQILHDWSDADSLRILKGVRAAFGDARGGKLVIVEACIASRLMTTTHTPRLQGDIHMLVQYGDAKERSEAEFGELLAASGFRLTRLLPTKSLFFVLEAEPV
ncbi:sfmM3 [Scenedesmus sp. PABB004]|nr:sfmM3 [Scenedesmus sp. PABB004]